MELKKLHYFSGIVIAVFVLLHFFNHFLSLWGANAHIEMMNNLRPVYRNALVESTLLLAVGMQIFSGVKLFLEKRKIVVGFFEKIQIWTGLYLASFFFIHLSAVFLGRLVLDLNTNFYFGVAGLNSFPLNLFFIPYYGLAIISFFGHLSAIHAKKMKREILGFKPEKQAYGMLIFGVIFTLIIFYGLTNGFRGVEIPAAYNILLGK